MISEQFLQENILSKTVAVGGVGLPVNQKIYASQFANNVIEVPGNVKMSPPGFFASLNPFEGKYTLPIDFEQQSVDAFPQPSYQHSIITNDANSLLVFQPMQIAPVNTGSGLDNVNRQKFPMKEQMKSKVLTDRESIVFY